VRSTIGFKSSSSCFSYNRKSFGQDFAEYFFKRFVAFFFQLIYFFEEVFFGMNVFCINGLLAQLLYLGIYFGQVFRDAAPKFERFISQGIVAQAFEFFGHFMYAINGAGIAGHVAVMFGAEHFFEGFSYEAEHISCFERVVWLNGQR